MDPTQGSPRPGDDPAPTPPGHVAPAGEPPAPPPGDPGTPSAADDSRLAEELAAASAALHAAEAAGGRARAGLVRWTGVVFGGAFAALLVRQPELALFLALAAMFALTQSWDARDRSRTGLAFADQLLEPSGAGRALRRLVPMLLPAFGAAGFAMFTAWSRSLPPTPAYVAAARWGALATVLCVALLLPPVARGFTALLVRPPSGSHTARLGASLALLVLLLPVPVRLVFDRILPFFSATEQPLVSVSGLAGQLAGEVVLALAAVGLWVSRTPRETWARLGLGRMGPREWLIALAGLGALTGLNSGLEWTEHSFLPELWRQDQAMGELITRDMAIGTMLMLGVSAGVGEEVVVRGALQPRTGILWASVLFAAAHVQYTWFGMLVIAALGVTLGLVRRYANTTTAIVVHAAYDVVAALAARS